MAVIALFAGFVLMPVLIFFAGSGLLGRYEGASVSRLFASIYGGLRKGSVASWIVLLGPYGLYLIMKGLRLWWRASSKLA
jgi:hypothetical protein